MIHELQDPFQVETPLGRGYAILVETANHDSWWTVILESGALVTFTQDRIMAKASYTYRRGIDDARMREILENALGRRRVCDPERDPAHSDSEASAAARRDADILRRMPE